MACALDLVVVNLSAEGLANLGCRAGKIDEHVVWIHSVHGEPVRRKPAGHLVDVSLRHAVVRANLLRGEPLVKVGRALVVEAGGVGVQSRLLRGVTIEKQLHVTERQPVVHLAEVVGGGGLRTGVARQRHLHRIVDWPDNSGVGSGGGLGRG